MADRARSIALRPRMPRRLATVALILVAVAWVLLLRPQFLGGPVAYVMVSGLSMEPTLHNGDLVLAKRRRSYGKGDVVAYRIPQGEAGSGSLVIHRIIGGSGASGFLIQGDNRDVPDIWHPKHEDIVGERWARVPGGGRVLALLHSPLALALFSTVLASLLGVPGAVGEASTRRRRDRGSRTPAPPAAIPPIVAVETATDAPRPVQIEFPYVGGARDWGEAAWTAPDVFQRDLRGRSGQ